MEYKTIIRTSKAMEVFKGGLADLNANALDFISRYHLKMPISKIPPISIAPSSGALPSGFHGYYAYCCTSVGWPPKYLDVFTVYDGLHIERTDRNCPFAIKIVPEHELKVILEEELVRQEKARERLLSRLANIKSGQSDLF